MQEGGKPLHNVVQKGKKIETGEYIKAKLETSDYIKASSGPLETKLLNLTKAVTTS